MELTLKTAFFRAPAKDVSTNQLLVRTLLEKLGSNVTLAVNGVDALEKVQQECYDIVLMDCHMPDMDGYCAAGKSANGNQANPRRNGCRSSR